MREKGGAVAVAAVAAAVLVGMAPVRAAEPPADTKPPVYAWDKDLRPLAARQKELATRPLPAALTPLPRVTCPLYVMEFHIWWRSPYGTEGRPGYGHWDVTDATDTATREASRGPHWMRDSRHVGYPVPGLYNSEDEGILRWQLRCLHNAGVDGVFIQMYPEWDRGDAFIGTAIFAHILKIAAEEGVKVGIHDEVAFRPNRPAQKPEVLAKRAGEFLKQFGDDPAFLRIDGKPAYAFQYWDRWKNSITDDQLVEAMKSAEGVYGKPVYWMPFHAPAPDLYSRPEIPGFVANGDSNMISRKATTFYPTDRRFAIRQMDERLSGYADALKRYPNKFLGMWAYPGFNDSPRPRPVQEFNWMPREGGKQLVDKLRRYLQEKPNFIMLSSWNDWDENTALEPGLSYDGFDGDPYLYCRILAGVKGKTFTPPPLPPKESVDRWLWQKLYGIDGEGPQITFQHTSNSPVTATATDPDSGVRDIRAAESGDLSADFTTSNGPHYTGFDAPTPGGAAIGAQGLTLVPDQSITLPVSAAALAGLRTGSPAPVYAGLVYTASAPGTIEVQFPSIHPRVQYKGIDYDEPKFPVHASFATDGNTSPSAAVRVLLEFQRDAPASFIRLTWRPASGAATSSTATIRRLDLFTAAKPGTAIRSKPGTDSKHQKIGTLPTTSGRPSGVIYVTAEDQAGNVGVPTPYLLP